jgi:hypothetical protein
MVETLSLWDSARSLFDNVRSALTPAPASSEALGAFSGTADETREMFDLIEARIAEARAAAAERGPDVKPTLEDYRQACVAFGETEQGQAMVNEGRWTPRAYANLGGQLGQGDTTRNHDLSGFAISEPQKRTMTDVLNLDSDGAINDFYTNIDFTGANLNNAYVDPATSFNEEIARAKNLDGLTFNDMRAGDRFTFGAGNYSNINMTGVNGGEITFANNSRVTGLDIQGTSATVTMGDYAMVSNITTSAGFSMVNLAMGEGAVLANSNLTNATISMASEFEQGGAFQNVQFGRNVAGLDFSGLELKNVSIDGVPIQRPSDLAQFGISYDEKTLASASPEMVRAYDLAQIRATMQEAVASIGSSGPAPAPAAQTAKVIAPLAAPDADNTLDSLARAQNIVAVNAANNPNDVLASIPASTAATAIAFGGDADFNTVTQTAAVTSQPRTVDPNDVATPLNMGRNSTASA